MTLKQQRTNSRWSSCVAVIAIGTVLSLGISVFPAGGSALPALQDPAALTANLSTPFSGCDPVGGSVSPASAQALSLVLPSAFITNPDGTVVQAPSFLAQAEVQSLSPLKIIYSILPNARWISGAPLGLRDFITTWKWGRNGFGPDANLYRQIRSITRGPSLHQIVVTFSTSTNNWQALFSPLLPSSFGLSGAGSCAYPTSNIDLSAGPYVIASSTPTTIVLIKNPHWWGSDAPFPSIELLGNTTSPDSLFGTTSNVGLDDTPGFSPSGTLAITSIASVSSKSDLSNLLLSLDFDSSRRHGLSKPLRLAVSEYVNRQQLIQATVGRVVSTVVPASSHLYSQGQISTSMNSPAPAWTRESKRQRQLLASKSLSALGMHKSNGFWVRKNGTMLSLSLGVPANDPWAVDVASVVKDQLISQGITVRLVGLATSSAVASAIEHSQVSGGFVSRPSSAFLSEAMAWFDSQSLAVTSAYWSGFNSPAINKLAHKASQQMNPQNAAPLYQSIDTSLWTSLPSLPLLTEVQTIAWSSAIQGVTTNPFPPGVLGGLLTWDVTAVNPSSV